jgi:hypothetical protein
MKAFLGILLVIWFFLTVFLVLTIVGWAILLPVSNDTGYYKPMTDERRSTWMLIGLGLFRKIIE